MAKDGLSRRAALAGAAGAAAAASAAPVPAAEAEAAPRATSGKRPNIVVILVDDVGYSDFGCYGGEIGTPHIDALAKGGVRYANFHTTGVCAATRASLMTGLNPHSAGIGWLTELDAGQPGYRGDLTHAAPTLAEALRGGGYSTWHCGKWHLNYAETGGTVGPMDNWPLQRGFDRAYWFQGHSTDFFRPGSLLEGNQQVEPGADFYVTDALTDRAVEYLREQHAEAPERPFFLYLAHPAAHSPLQAWPDDLAAVRGRYDGGWDATREARLARQKAMGLVPETTRLPAPGPGVAAWASLDADRRRLFARYMEAYAACVARLDASVGRLVAALSELGRLDDTLIVLASDNGGSPDGGPNGTTNLMAGVNGGVSIPEAVAMIDEIGGPDAYAMYPMGWAMASNTPFRLYKHDTHLGGVADPLVAHWPAAIAERGGIRPQYAHVIDLFPTLLDCAGVAAPKSHDGRAVKPVQGVSFRGSLTDPNAPETRTEQHYEMNGQRALYSNGMRLVSAGRYGDPQDRWELFDTTVERNEVTDLAAARPELVKRLEARWMALAKRYDVLPIDPRTQRQKSFVEFFEGGGRAAWDLRPPLSVMPAHAAPAFFGRSHRIEIEIDPLGAKDEGVLLAYGNLFLGFVLYVKAGRVHYEAVSRPKTLTLSGPAHAGARRIVFEQALTARPWTGGGALSVDGRTAASADWPRALMGRPMQGMQIGRNDQAQVSGAYDQPFAFTGRIERVRVRLDTSPYTPAEIQSFDDAFRR